MHRNKIIAREFLLIFSTLVFALIVFLLISSANWYNASKVEYFQKHISSKEKEYDNLNFSYDDKMDAHQWFYDEHKKKFDMGEDSSSEIFWSKFYNLYYHDSLNFFYDNIWQNSYVQFLKSLSFINADTFHRFIANNVITVVDNSHKLKADALETELDNLRPQREKSNSNLVGKKDQISFTFQSLFILLIVLYPIRFLYLMLIWSFKTLRKKS